MTVHILSPSPPPSPLAHTCAGVHIWSCSVPPSLYHVHWYCGVSGVPVPMDKGMHTLMWLVDLLLYTSDPISAFLMFHFLLFYYKCTCTRASMDGLVYMCWGKVLNSPSLCWWRQTGTCMVVLNIDPFLKILIDASGLLNPGRLLDHYFQLPPSPPC